MPRTPADATRFTATGPYAHSRPPTVPSSGSSPNSPPFKETPHEKVARLREAARRARAGQLSTFDKVVIRGRVWADTAHRWVTLGLIGATAICGVYATVALSDMVLYNRRKRREFYAAQVALYTQHLSEARTALAHNTATPQQIRLIEEDELAEREKQERLRKKGIWKGIKRALFSGLKTDEDEPLEEKREDSSLASVPQRVQAKIKAGEGAVLSAVQEHRQRQEAEGDVRRAITEEVAPRKGGMLDRLGEGEPNSSRNWTTWLSRKGGKDGDSR
ncbi:MAG: hypothetical protein M1817_002946 [Caeruleum heppii]|nr:MAG: hypothetical protein M1817_002946 [Caeruleum heppii]